MGTWILNNRDPLVFRLYILFSWCRFWWWKVGHGAPHAGGHVHCRGRFLGTIGQDPSVSKSTWLHVDIIQFFFINSSYFYISVAFLKSWTSTSYFSNSTALVENLVKKTRSRGSFDHPDLQSVNDCKFVVLVYQLKFWERTTMGKWLGSFLLCFLLVLVHLHFASLKCRQSIDNRWSSCKIISLMSHDAKNC